MLTGFAKNLQYNGYLLRDMPNPTEEMCIVAVKQNGLALRFVENQNDKICLTAVRQTGLALQFVKEQTEEICITAANQNRKAIGYIKDPVLRKKLSEEADTIILHPGMDLDDVIELVGRTKTIKPPSGSFASEMKGKMYR